MIQRPIAEKVRRARQARGLTQVALAQAAGLHPATIIRLESGDASPPRLSTLRLIGLVLEIDLLVDVA